MASSASPAPRPSSPAPQDPEIYFTPFSHLDFYWGGTREECLARGNAIVAKAIRLAGQSPRFHFLLEDDVFVSNYVETHQGSQELADLKRLVQEGRIEIVPKWAAIFQGLPASLHYPPPRTYVFHYSLSSAPGDWRQSKAYRTGMGFNNPLLPVSVVDTLSGKSLPPSGSFCSLKQDNLVLGTLKKSDLGPSILLRVYEIEGRPVETPIEFLGRPRTFGEVNLLEEDLAGPPGELLRCGPYAIKTVKLSLDRTRSPGVDYPP